MSISPKPRFASWLIAPAQRLATSVLAWFFITVAAAASLFCYHFSLDKRSDWWSDFFALTSNLLLGALVSFLFYYLVVFIPETRKKRIIKINLRNTYKQIKEDILLEVIHVSINGGRLDLQADAETIKRLSTTKGFQDAFKDGREATEGFYAFENQMSYDNPQFREIIVNFQILQKQIEFILHNYSINDQKLFNFFKRLESALTKLQNSTTGYDEANLFCSFIFQMLGGWDVIEGFRDYDLIEKRSMTFSSRCPDGSSPRTALNGHREARAVLLQHWNHACSATQRQLWRNGRRN